MSYLDICKTDVERRIYEEILQLSKGHTFVAFQELQFPDISKQEIIDALKHFDSSNLLRDVQHLGDDFLIIFRSPT